MVKIYIFVVRLFSKCSGLYMTSLFSTFSGLYMTSLFYNTPNDRVVSLLTQNRESILFKTKSFDTNIITNENKTNKLRNPNVI